MGSVSTFFREYIVGVEMIVAKSNQTNEAYGVRVNVTNMKPTV
jgi:hypothetical protein